MLLLWGSWNLPGWWSFGAELSVGKHQGLHKKSGAVMGLRTQAVLNVNGLVRVAKGCL